MGKTAFDSCSCFFNLTCIIFIYYKDIYYFIQGIGNFFRCSKYLNPDFQTEQTDRSEKA